MTTSNTKQIFFGLLTTAAIYFAVQLVCWLSPVIYTWNERIADKILAFKSSLTIVRPDYLETVAIIGLNNTSLQALNNYQPDRAFYAKVIRNLADLGVALQTYDIVFAGHKSAEKDRDLVRSAMNANNAIFGMVFNLDPKHGSIQSDSGERGANAFINQTKWRNVKIDSLPDLYYGIDPIISFDDLARASRGLGYLTLAPDKDGVFRRLPLLIRYEDAVYPSLALKIVCEYLNVSPVNVIVGSDSVTLRSASRPGASESNDIKIPVDPSGSMRINFVGPWGRMKHYNFSDIYFASKDNPDWELWQKEMKGKVVLISDTYTGSTDVGAVPVDNAYPLSGVHANAVHTILAEDFIQDISGHIILLMELLLVAMLFCIYLSQSSFRLCAFALSISVIYFAAAAAALILMNMFIPIAKSLILILFTWGGLFTLKSVQNAYERLKVQNAKEIAERELEIGRKIQADFLPSELPKFKGWQIETYFKPANQVSGDFYDVFELSGGRYHAIVLGDVCDHGVGSALFMAVVRSMVRIFSLQSSSQSPEDLILETVQRTNNYIAENHGDTGMFATMFLGFLDSESGEMYYVNCGHEPPPLVRNGKIKHLLKPSGLPVGAMEDSPYTCHKITFQKEDYLFLYTDGITDGLDSEGNSFSKERLLDCVAANHTSLHSLVKGLEDAFFSHVSGGEVTDDVTFLALKRGIA